MGLDKLVAFGYLTGLVIDLGSTVSDAGAKDGQP